MSYASINGLEMYYEVSGDGKPLVCIPPAFGHAGAKHLAFSNRSVVTMDLQGHGRTADIDRPLSFEQHARDVLALLQHLEISKADFFGESFGGLIAALIAVRNPAIVDRLVTYGTSYGHARDAVRADVLATPATADGRGIQHQRESYERVAPDPTHWPTLWAKVGSAEWAGFSSAELASITARVLVIVGDHDFVRLEHALDVFRKIPHAELAVIPGASHFALFSEPQRVLPSIERFLTEPAAQLPFATAATGFQPGVTR
jgi:pimeloyl-ACP methyl ester carboxylesterase